MTSRTTGGKVSRLCRWVSLRSTSQDLGRIGPRSSDTRTRSARVFVDVTLSLVYTFLRDPLLSGRTTVSGDWVPRMDVGDSTGLLRTRRQGFHSGCYDSNVYCSVRRDSRTFYQKRVLLPESSVTSSGGSVGRD